MIRKLVLFAFTGVMLFFGAAILLIGGLFAWKLVSADTAKVAFQAPQADWALQIEETCLLGPCYKYPKLVVSTGWFSSRELQCDLAGADPSRAVFDNVVSVEWRDNDTKVDWIAGDPPTSGTIDLLSDCYISAVVDDRASMTSIRFHENCLTGACRRSAMWMETRGSYIYTTPCRVAASGEERLFTVPGDPGGQVSTRIDGEKRLAEWTSTGTGQTGVIDFAEHCDISKQRREPVPA